MKSADDIITWCAVVNDRCSYWNWLSSWVQCRSRCLLMMFDCQWLGLHHWCVRWCGDGRLAVGIEGEC